MPERRPNLLLLLTDQQRGDCLGIEGHPVLQTPNMDYLGHSGTHFKQGYTEAPSCIPARRTVMSGQAPAAHGMVGFQGGVAWDPPHTLAGELGGAGYQCEMIGKLHLWPHRRRYGFDHMWLADSTRGGHNDYVDWLGGAAPIERWAMAHGATPNGWIGRPSHLPEIESHSFWCVTQAIQFLDRRDPSAPFFLNVSFIDPHPPMTPPQFYYDRYASRDLGKPVMGDWSPHFEAPVRGLNPEGQRSGQRVRLDADAMHYCRAGYYGLINHVDNQVGRLLQYMRDSKLLENTFILFTADHGEMLGDHDMFAKTRPFNGSARVPFLARAPQSFDYPDQVVTQSPVGLQDVMPTLLDAAGLPIPESCTGLSVLPLMRGAQPGTREAGAPTSKDSWREALHGEHSAQYDEGDAMHYLVDGHTKYVWYSGSGRELLFDLDADPAETHDLLRDPDADTRVAPWRQRLVDVLRDRPEGFVSASQLVPGRPHPKLVPGMA